MKQSEFPEAREKGLLGFLEKFRNKLLEFSSKDIYRSGWNAAVKYLTPRYFQIRSTVNIAIKEYTEKNGLSQDTLGMLELISKDVLDYEKNTLECFDEMEGSLRSIRKLFENEESDMAKTVTRFCDSGLWRIENGKYRNK